MEPRTVLVTWIIWPVVVSRRKISKLASLFWPVTRSRSEKNAT